MPNTVFVSEKIYSRITQSIYPLSTDKKYYKYIDPILTTNGPGFNTNVMDCFVLNYKMDGYGHSHVLSTDIYSENQYGCIEGSIEKLNEGGEEDYSGTIKVTHTNSGITVFNGHFEGSFYVDGLNMNENYTVVCIPYDSIYQSKSISTKPFIDVNKHTIAKVIGSYYSPLIYSANIYIDSVLNADLAIIISANQTNVLTKLSDNIYNIKITNPIPLSSYYVNITNLISNHQDVFTFDIK